MHFLKFILLFSVLFLPSCFLDGGEVRLGNGKGRPGGPATTNENPGPNGATLSWLANRERSVNAPGGGYRVLYSQNAGFSVAQATGHIDVPYVSGAATPTSAHIAGLSNGTYYFKVVAYSPLNPPGSTNGSVSTESTEVSITLP